VVWCPWVDVGSKSAKLGLVYWIRSEENNRFPGQRRDVLMFVAGRTAVDVGRRKDVFVIPVMAVYGKLHVLRILKTSK
jgi:hypothetical protein